MRRITPLVIGVVTSTLFIGAALVPNSAAADTEGDQGPPLNSGRCVTEFVPPAGVDTAFGISGGPGGVWFSHGGTLDRVTANGIEEFPIPDAATASAGTLAFKPGGPLWFADRGKGRIGTIDRRGTVYTYDVPGQPGSTAVPQGIVIGPGPNVWFTDFANGSIDRLHTDTAVVNVYPIPTPASGPLGLVRGPDGALWFTERTAAKAGRMAADGTFTEWPLAPGAFPNRIIVGPDRAIWFTELNAGKLGRIDRSGKLVEYPISGGPVGITTGPGRAMFVTLSTDKALARVNTSAQITGRWDLPGAARPTQTATIGDDVWVADPFSDTVYRVRPHCG